MLNLKNKYLVVIAGPTALGKTEAGVKIASHFNAPVISADSRQIYKELKTGTSAPSEEQMGKVPHYFVSCRSIHEEFNASMFEAETDLLLSELYTSHAIVLLVGGSGLYIDAVCKGIDELPPVDRDIRKRIQEQLQKEGIGSLRRDLKILDPVTYSRIDLKNHKRIQKALEVTIMTGKPYSSFLTKPEKKRNYTIIRIALNLEREELYTIINKRVLSMMDKGFEEEARSVYEYRGMNSLNTLGYKELFAYFEGKISREEAIAAIQSNTRKYARKQLTWFRKDPSYQWFHPARQKEIILYIENRIKDIELKSRSEWE